MLSTQIRCPKQKVHTWIFFIKVSFKDFTVKSQICSKSNNIICSIQNSIQFKFFQIFIYHAQHVVVKAYHTKWQPLFVNKEMSKHLVSEKEILALFNVERYNI